MTVGIDGTGAELLSTTGPDYGYALVSVDGGTPQIVSFYSSSYLHKQIVWGAYGLTTGVHRIEIAFAHDKDAASTGYLVGFDGIDVEGSLVSLP